MSLSLRVSHFRTCDYNTEKNSTQPTEKTLNLISKRLAIKSPK